MWHIFHIDILTTAKALGYTGLFLVIFLESGVVFGFFLPGASLLFAAGIIASQGFLNMWILVPLLGIAAILGDNAGYWFGAKTGPAIFRYEDSFWFNKKNIDRAETFYKKYGPQTILLARFVPVVRTFVPILAGVGKMKYRTFFSYNVIGGILWAIGVTLLGYFLGTEFPGVDRYLPVIVLAIILITSFPLLRGLHIFKTSEK
ncbi:MAG TPA: VTT domain-containing protein [Candidatus Paceibacterota bacterium]|nr:VTT domain-containing protein [Candidatus Paceibacterota bacterium]